jgi:SOS-response transcriptional repressor LexA
MQRRPVRLVAAILLCAAGAITAAQSTLAQLGFDEPEAKNMLLSSVSSGAVYVGSGAARAFKAAPAATQKSIVEGLLAWAKGYAASAEFKRAYAGRREGSRPEPPDPASGMPDEKKQQAEIEQMKKMAASLPPEQRKAIEDTIKMMQDMQKDPQMRQLQAQGAKMAQKAAQDDHQLALAKWNEEFPENANVLIARRLRKFLDVSADVDFAAKLVPSGDKMKFADAKYEQRSAEWKMCYRAGPDALAAARAVAAAWLREIAPK